MIKLRDTWVDFLEANVNKARFSKSEIESIHRKIKGFEKRGFYLVQTYEEKAFPKVGT